ncbi:serine--tRNA ligase [Roseiflexus sp. RS-1]|uniref:Serine--tRNA ligase n=1 Tax=Roseiflexus sp. (strain RS-1) TaxID=357808 RepID=SYS_ROSS1|nr:serine--tRNA ligase [Roseiflexus sp. RS-1]A5UYX1.1 RecName: Full=Serine--tRNA ligase; AltName: Full=Seryl-tRNA synthetase; Short=SerRS; AltName: Full=Seryl-tRNA(Ser/Sec) synthetase [Roseiflexus sp. RS-1]ABQ91824.1 seryl-tRNA synthetase [Roseiflexus sp. RS-1]
MLDIRLIREQPDLVKASLGRTGVDPAQVDAVLAYDEQRRALLREVEQLKALRNAVSKEIGKMSDAAARDAKIAEMRAVGDRIAELDRELAAVEEQQYAALMELRNLPHPSVPDGPDETYNVVIAQEGEPRTFDFTPKPHWELGEALDIIDFERGVKLSGSRFYVLKGPGARLQRALIQWMLDLHGKQGYDEVYTPFVVKEQCMWGARQLPKFRDNLYRDVEDDLWLVPTAEVPVTNLHRDEILDADQLPLRYCAYTPCFRREKMSAGRDVRGIKRGHQFDKVEMYMFVRPETSYDELEKLRADAEETCRLLGLPFRTKELCTGDLGFAATRTYDIEVWAPGQGEWLEVSSCSNVEAFQARAANIRYRPEPGARPEYVHTLNGSGLGLPRTLIAILENYQQADGSVVIPEVLRPYMGGIEVIRRT